MYLLLAVLLFFVFWFSKKENFQGYSNTWKNNARSKPASYPASGETWFLNQYVSPVNYKSGLPNVEYD